MHRKTIRSTKAQIRYLCLYMKEHPEMATAGEHRSGFELSINQREWEQLASTLAKLGPQRSVEQWKTCWRDQKRKSRIEGSLLMDQNTTEDFEPNLSEFKPELSRNASPVSDPIGPNMVVDCDIPNIEIEWLDESVPSPQNSVAAPSALHCDRSVTPSIQPLSGPAASHSAMQSTRVRTLRKRQRMKTYPPERFLGAQEELNNLLRELTADFRRSQTELNCSVRELTTELKRGQMEISTSLRQLTTEVRRSNNLRVEHLNILRLRPDAADVP